MQSIIQRDKYDGCFICRGIATDEHHIFGGRNRGKSEEYGLKVFLCRRCHTGIHNSTEGSAYKDAEMFLKKVGQQEFEQKIGDRDLFMREFGRNYEDD